MIQDYLYKLYTNRFDCICMYRSVHDATETFSEMMSIAHVVGVAIIGLVLCMAKLCKPKEGDIPGRCDSL